ncbi:hypothetical protein Tco_1462092, partial [Tanacetum coccineum]
MSASMEVRIAEHAAAPTPPLLVASPPSPLPSPLTTNPTDAGTPLGYRAAGIWMRAASLPLLLPSTSHRTDIPEAEMPPQKKAALLLPLPDSRSGRVQQLVLRDSQGLLWRLTLGMRLQETEKFQVRFEDAQDDRAYLRARVNTLLRDRPYHRHTTMILDRELTTELGRIETLEARDPEPQDELARLAVAVKRGVAAVLAKRDADRNRNGDYSHDSGTDRKRQVYTVH